MKERFNYNYDEETGILFKNYFGKITLKDITSSWDKEIKNNKIPSNTKGFVLDYRDATFDLKENEISGISDYYKNNLKIFNNMRIAIITESPKDIVVPFLVKENDFNYSSKPFTTVKAAINWVLHQ